MADHRAEQIIAAAKTALDALATAGTVDAVNRGRDVPLAKDTNKALDVYLGQDTVNRYAWPLVYSDLTINIDIRVKSYTEQVDTLLNAIRKAVNVTLFTDYTLGLSFVSDLNEGPADAPTIDGSSEETTAVMNTTWVYEYSRNHADPST